MKIRSTDELIDFLGEGKQRRKRELISLSQELSDPKRKTTARTCRTAVVLAYAHWEGFVKDAAQAYVRFVSSKSRCLKMMAINFQALACRQELQVAQAATRRIQPHITLTKRLTDEIARGYSLDATTAIDTESNLNAEVFENICLCVGVDFQSTWAMKGPFMNDLLRFRCKVAHGNLYTPEIKYARETVEFCIEAIDQFSTEIENAALLERYMR